MRIASALLAGVCLVVSVGGCGLATSDSPEPISQENLPEDLGGPPGPEPREVTDGEGVDVRLFFVDDDELEDPVLSSVAAPLVNDSPQVLLEALLGFDQGELEADGHRSAIPSSLDRSDVRVEGEVSDDGVLVVDLPEAFYEDPAEGDGPLAVGQVVMTVTMLPNVERVQFLQDGEEKPVLNGESNSVEGPVAAADYQDLLAS